MKADYSYWTACLVGLGLVLAMPHTARADETPQDSGAAKLAGQPPVRAIFDTDMDSDCDDAAALGLLHALADRGEVEILAAMISGLNHFAGPCADAINTYYSRPHVPIGAARAPAPKQASKYTEGVAQRCPHKLKQSDDAPDAVELYRDLLAKQDDGSVTVITVGDMTNLAKLLRLAATDDKPSGKDLARRKVKLWVCMGGNFIGKPARDDLKLGNNNFTLNPTATYEAITAWPTPIVFAGREVCSVPSGLKVGAGFRKLPADNPVRIAYELYFGGPAQDRHVADLATVLFAVRGLRDYWDAEGHGRMDLNRDMTFSWRPDRDGNQAYLLKRTVDGKPNDRQIEKVLEELLLTPPKRAK